MTNTYPAIAAVRRNKRVLPQASHRGATWHCSKQSAVLNELWFITWDPTEPVATRPLAIQKDGTWYTYGLDLPKNITEVYGTNGGIKTAYTYTPYGEVTSSGNTVQPLQGSSEYSDAELALVYYNYRHYNPLDGRWCGRDLIGSRGGWHAYSYVSNHVYYAYDHVGSEAPISQDNNVEQHEMHHVEITGKYWDAFVAKSKGMEGCYCSPECMIYALIVVRESYKLNQALANRDNATFDLKEYGRGDAPPSYLTQQYNDALGEIQKAKKELDHYWRKF